MRLKHPITDEELLSRATELDALEAILPFHRCDQLAGLLTDDDVATLKHLAQEGMGENTLRALASDLGYLEEWARLATGSPLPWPAPEAMLLKFVAHHLWDPAKRAADATHEHKFQPIHLLDMERNAEILDLLLANGADINARNDEGVPFYIS